MKKFIEKNKVLLLIVLLMLLLVTLVGLLFGINTKKANSPKEVNEKNYSFQYDPTWKIEELKEQEVKLLHKKSKGELKVTIQELEEEIQYHSVEEIFDDVFYNMQQQNKNYKLLYKEKEKITKNKLNGYKLLLESDSHQVEVLFYKQGNKIVLLSYEAPHEYFDILLDSATTILNSFCLNEQKFDVTTKINLETKKITYTEEKNLVNLLNEQKQEQIASNHYLVNYSIPNSFQTTEYNSKEGKYRLEGLPSGTSLKLKTDIVNVNLYEYLDKENSSSLYHNYNLNSYNKTNEALEKLREEPVSYLYKNEYLTNNAITENMELIIALNENHIFRVKICSEGIGIPEELINKVQINNIENYASHVNVEKEEGFLIGKLKRFLGYSYEQTEEIKLKIPENFKELDQERNEYEERNYAFHLDEQKKIYEYEVTYRTISYDIEGELKVLENSIHKNYGEYKDFSKKEDITVNDKTFQVYERGYTRRSEELDEKGNQYSYYANEKVLFYKLQENGYLVIRITANEKGVSDELIQQLTNFEVKN